MAERKTIPLRTAGEMLGVSHITAIRLANAGTFPVPVIRVGKKFVVPKGAVEKLLQEGSANAGMAA